MQAIMLNFNYNALEPYISALTIDVHYNRHYLSYLKNLNKLLKENNITDDYKIVDIFSNLDIFKTKNQKDVLFNAGGVVNHELYFSILTPNPVKEIPNPLRGKIVNKFGSLENFKQRFIENATNLKGSGYTFLAVDKTTKELVLLNLPIQETPYSYGMIPIIALDVWEHAYYLDRLNERNIYIMAFFEVLDYDIVNEYYQKALKD